MIYITGTKEIHLENTAVALGKFDGLHRGHQILIEKIKEHKAQGLQAVMFTFDFHPAALLSNKPQELIFTRDERIKWAEKMGIDVLIEFPFTKETSGMEAEDFIKDILIDAIGAKVIVAGSDFHFGHERRGNVEMLKAVGKELGFSVDVCHKLQTLAPVFEDGAFTGRKELRDVSSTLIREAIRRGDMEFAAEMLGTPFSVSGEVIHGRQLGRKLGMPTANVAPPLHKIMPPNGVYSSRTLVGDYVYHSVTNIGFNPTVADNNSKRMETYVYDFSGSLYGEEIEVQLFRFERPEMKFDSVEDLKNQIHLDKAKTMEYFGTHYHI
ncbi:MAG: bifunctional riboflavin kinase/FAD synthetase [Clostridia bacterium]|nr:bifunctional riboflavin kinase/FAD synthetase [Lachnospiraceae bacterium]NCC02026.1 bifunctional riboflavin kinase/FAD synthetase [Clostridia bacterium]NCD04084.1 bifunctional riboflavin kinase/FAD synthetase [Clostridia bacterium]